MLRKLLRMSAPRAATDHLPWLGALLLGAVLAALAVEVSWSEQVRRPQQRALDPLGVALLLAGSAPVIVMRRGRRR